MTRPIYVASRASVPERAVMWRHLRTSGWPINSTWIDEAGPGETADLGELWQRIVGEIQASAGVVLYAEPGDFPLKGAFIEVGIALGMGKRVFCVLPGVELERPSMRPVGSWLMHPWVTLHDTLADAREAIDRREDIFERVKPFHTHGMQPGETPAQAAERWAQWCERRCLSMLPEFLRHLAGLLPLADGTGRTPTDYALEHAEYLAQGAEQLLEACNTLHMAVGALNESGDDADDEALQQAREAFTEHFTSLRGDIHQFRTRRDRAARTTQASAPSVQETGWLIEHSGEMPGLDTPRVSWLKVEAKAGGYGEQEFGFTHDASKALRFARREDAEAVLKMHLGALPPPWWSRLYTVTEHMWPAQGT